MAADGVKLEEELDCIRRGACGWVHENVLLIFWCFPEFCYFCLGVRGSWGNILEVVRKLKTT